MMSLCLVINALINSGWAGREGCHYCLNNWIKSKTPVCSDTELIVQLWINYLLYRGWSAVADLVLVLFYVQPFSLHPLFTRVF